MQRLAPDACMQVARFFNDYASESLEKRLTVEIVEVCYAQIDNITPKMFVDKYPGLKKTFKEYGLDVKHL